MNEISECCEALIRYLDCEDCKGTDKECIYICTECGKEKVESRIQNIKSVTAEKVEQKHEASVLENKHNELFGDKS